MDQGKYIYCIINKPSSFVCMGLTGINGKEVQLCHRDTLAAVVSDSPLVEYPLTRENMVTHERVIESVMTYHRPVLPLSFGIVAESEDAVQSRLLKVFKDELDSELARLMGTVEVNLKAIWLDMQLVYSILLQENEKLRHTKQELQGRVLSRNEAIEVGEYIAAEIENRKRHIKQDVLRLVKPYIIEYKETQFLGEEMIFNLAFLIPEGRQQDIDEVVGNLDDRYSSERIYFKYIGPLPTFNFVTLQLHF